MKYRFNTHDEYLRRQILKNLHFQNSMSLIFGMMALVVACCAFHYQQWTLCFAATCLAFVLFINSLSFCHLIFTELFEQCRDARREEREDERENEKEDYWR